MGVSIKELADCIKGEIINCSDQSEGKIESLMIGAMCVDPSPLYFNIKSEKAVITRGDRLDIQLGALETSTKCLILTGGDKPHPSVLQRADEKKVPILVVPIDTPSTLAKLEEGLGQIDIETSPENSGINDEESSTEESS